MSFTTGLATVTSGAGGAPFWALAGLERGERTRSATAAAAIIPKTTAKLWLHLIMCRPHLHQEFQKSSDSRTLQHSGHAARGLMLHYASFLALALASILIKSVHLA